MENLDTTLPVKIEKALVRGNNRTRTSFFESEVDALLSQSLPLEKLSHELQGLSASLQSRGIFEAVNVDLVLKDVNQDSNNFVADIHIDVIEKGIPSIKVETYVRSRSTSSNEIGCAAQGILRNPFGAGDFHKISISNNSSGEAQDISLSSHVPYFIPPNSSFFKKTGGIGTLDASLSSAEVDNSYYLSYKQRVNSLSIDLSTTKPSTPIQQKVQLEVASRVETPLQLNLLAASQTTGENPSFLSKFPKFENLFKIFQFDSNASKTPAPTAALSGKESVYANNTVASQCSTTTKVSLKYTGTLADTRDSSSAPTSGRLLQVTYRHCSSCMHRCSCCERLRRWTEMSFSFSFLVICITCVWSSCLVVIVVTKTLVLSYHSCETFVE